MPADMGSMEMVMLPWVFRCRCHWKSIRFFGILCVCTLALLPSAFPLNPRIAVSQYSHRMWQIEQGLPQVSVHAISQTTDGYIWIGTEDGLARFDGLQFTIFDQQALRGIESISFEGMLTAPDGSLWASTTGGLIHLSKDRFKIYTSRDGIPRAHFSAMVMDNAGVLWIGSKGSGLVRLDQNGFTKYTTSDGLIHDEIWALEFTEDGSIWIGTRGGLSRYKNGQFTSFTVANGLSDNWVCALHKDQSGGLWVGTDKGLDHVRIGATPAISKHQGLQQVSVQSLLVDRNGVTWIGTHGMGLKRMQGDKIDTLSPAEGLSDDYVLSLFEDREGNLWVGTSNGGLNCLRDSIVQSYGKPEGLPPGSVQSVREDRNGAIWIGSEKDGLLWLKNGKVRQYTMRDGMLQNSGGALTEDARGDMWIGSDVGLNRIHNGQVSNIPAGPDAPVSYVRVIYPARDGSIWIGTKGNGVLKYSNGRYTRFTKKNGLPDDWVRVILQDSQGTFWFGTNAGLACLKNDRFIKYDFSSGLPQNSITALYEDRDGVLWIGTYGGGLVRLSKGEFKTISTRQGLAHDVIYAILEDNLNYLWFSCNQGIFRVGREDLNALVRGKRPRVSSTFFDTSDGMRSRECNGGTQPSAWKGADGRLWFATIEGAVSVDPAHLEMQTPPPTVLLKSVRINGENVDFTNPRSLPPSRGDMEFEYTGLSFIAPERVRFSYKLTGFDNDWIDAGTRRTAFYTKVPPGRYTFVVQAINRDGLWSRNGVSFTFVLRPAFYQTRWFYGICIVGFVGLGVGIYLLRLRVLKVREHQLVQLVDERTLELKKEVNERRQAQEEAMEARIQAESANRTKSEFLANMSHELRTPLNAIIGYSELLQEEVYTISPEKTVADLKKIRAAGKHLLELINEILDFAKLEAGKMGISREVFDVRTLVEDVAVMVQPLAEKNQNKLFVHCPPDLGVMNADPLKVRQILFNLLSNACKFTDRGEINFGSERQNHAGKEWICFRIKDTGIGIAPDQVSRLFQPFSQADSSTSRKYGGTGLGLTISQQFAQLMGGNITVESVPGEGSTFSLKIPAE